MRPLVLLLSGAVLCGSTLTAQTVRVGAYGVGVTHAEARENRRATGAGGGASLTLNVARFRLEVSGYTAELDSTFGGTAPFRVVQGDVWLGFAVMDALAIELGASSRTVDPEFAAQDVAVGRVGLRSEVALGQRAAVWARGAYLVAPQFTGGGSAGLAIELGLGVAYGTSNGRVRGRADYQFQRLDRKVGGAAVPIQVQMARIGIEVGF